MKPFTYTDFLEKTGLRDSPQARALHAAWEESLSLYRGLPPGEPYEVDLGGKGCVWVYALLILLAALVAAHIF